MRFRPEKALREGVRRRLPVQVEQPGGEAAEADPVRLEVEGEDGVFGPGRRPADQPGDRGESVRLAQGRVGPLDLVRPEADHTSIDDE